MVEAQLAERSLPTPEICSSNSDIGNISNVFICQLLSRKDENKEKEAGKGPFKKTINVLLASTFNQWALLEVERAHYFWARAELELWGSSPNEPKPMKNTTEPASSSSFSFIKTGNFKGEPTWGFCKNQVVEPQALSLRLIYCEPLSLSPGSFHF